MDDRCCMRRKQAAACGCYCGDCRACQDGTCSGCGYQLGLTPRGECALFQCCVTQRGLEHCGLCVDFPCQVFMSHAQPIDVARHYQSLRRRTEIGTIAWLDEQETA